jgi:RNA 3'-terminal phosphate cyclase (ATP)
MVRADVLKIDGSIGEGGGQILRTSLSLSLVTGKPFRIDNIRAGREKPGLLRQHLTAVLAAAEIGNAKLEGAELRSTALSFTPGAVRPGDYHFAVGTAGSGTLVLQTVLPPLMLASGPSKLVIEGGTHNHGAPPYHYMEKVFLPLIQKMGPRVTTRLERFGFYPAGGGRFVVEIEPVKKLDGLHLGERGEAISRRVHAVVANLPRHIAQREAETAAGMLTWGQESHHVEVTRESPGPGNVVMIHVVSEPLTEMFTEFGKLGVSAEKVAETAAREAREYLASTATAGEHLTDQLLLPMALAGSGSFTALKLNMHARTNMEVISRFLPIGFRSNDADRHVKVVIETC